MVERHLVLVTNPHNNRRTDFETIARLVAREDPRTRALIVRDRPHRVRRLLIGARPTLVFCPGPIERFRPRRGTVFQGRWLRKSEQYRRLEQAGVPVPAWTSIEAGPPPDLAAFGPYVVLKPDQGTRGAEVRIVRRGRVRWRPTLTKAGISDTLLAQEFVYTGPWPSSYRVVTLFGEALMCFRMEASHDRPPLPERYGFRGDGVCIVSSSRGCTYTLEADAEVVRLAERAHAPFPERPLLGVDIVREQPSNRLYVVEVNPAGRTWHFSTPASLQIQRQFGLDPYGQMGGLPKAARILAEQTRRHAS